MKRMKLEGTGLHVRNFGVGRSRLTIIEPDDVACGYDPIRIQGCSVILFNASVRPQLSKFYAQVYSRPRRNDVFPGGISSTADDSIKEYLGLK